MNNRHALVQQIYPVDNTYINDINNNNNNNNNNNLVIIIIFNNNNNNKNNKNNNKDIVVRFHLEISGTY